jgi:hypothetical protein
MDRIQRPICLLDPPGLSDQSMAPCTTSAGSRTARRTGRPIQGGELRALRRLQRESPTSPFVFVSERGSPFTAGFARMIERALAGHGCPIK